MGDLPSAQRPIGQVTQQLASGECMLGDEVVDPGEIVAPLVHFCASWYSRRRHGRLQRAKALGLAPPLQGPGRIWSQDCDLSGEPDSSGRCVDVQPERILLLLARRMTCEAIALVLSALRAVVVGAILTFDSVTVYRGHLHFRSVGWRLARWAAWFSFFVGIGVAASFCGSRST